jgi:peroxin-13
MKIYPWMRLAAGNPPPKPWERAGASSGPVPIKPPSGGSTSDIVEASGKTKHGEAVFAAGNNVASNLNNNISMTVPPRPWQQQDYGNSYGGN